MSPPAMSFGDGFCMSTKVGEQEVGWYTQRVKNRMAMFVLAVKIPQ